MKQDQPTPGPTDDISLLPPASRNHWTPARQRIFLAALVETGSIARAARAAGMSRSSAHALRNRLPGTPFDYAWDRALRLHAARLADPFAPDLLAPRPAVAGPASCPPVAPPTRA
ncbi:LysR family transcriptional regulator [Sphingomonas sp.]|uniref:LysR family transcriptional regulator n=1 Tax=Sphingomonas sp. TaxID=28214 RepID=UPI002ED8844B